MKSISIYSDDFDYLMKNDEFSVGFNMPEALSGEKAFDLPPYARCKPRLVDKYTACPKDWLRSEGIIKSFFVPVVEGKGMWLDLNYNFNHTYHVAIVISIQGINPITGLPCKDSQLEQYNEECPKHKIKFGPDRYCSKCDYKWPKQNYICTTGTPIGSLWLDGFRTVDGLVRQYILTAEKMRGVASNLIGKDRVYAIGLSYFLSKEIKPNDSCKYPVLEDLYPYEKKTYMEMPQQPNTPYWSVKYLDHTYNTCHNPFTASYCNDNTEMNMSSKNDANSYKCSTGLLRSCSFKGAKQPIETKKIEIGAGARIQQLVYDDPMKLDFWRDKPEAIICINYASLEDVQKILKQDEINLEGNKEGFLKDTPFGN